MYIELLKGITFILTRVEKSGEEVIILYHMSLEVAKPMKVFYVIFL